MALAATVRPARRRRRSDGPAGRLVDILSSCLPAVSSKRRHQPVDGVQLTLDCAKSEVVLALNRRVADRLDLDQITAWQADLTQV